MGNVNKSDTAVNAEANALAVLMNSGTINVYSGPMPGNANTALSGANNLLATLTFSSTAFGTAASGVISANAITAGTAIANGTATFARILQSDGTTVVMDVTVGVAGSGGINFSTTTIVVGNAVQLNNWMHTIVETLV